LFVVSRENPIRGVGDRAVGGSGNIAEEVLEPAFVNEGIAFQVEKHVPVRGRRKAGKPESRCNWEKFVKQRTRVAALDLYTCLLTYPLVRRRRAPRGLPGERHRHRGQRRRGVDALPLQFLDLHLGDAGDQREMIIVSPPCVASLLPSADFALVPRLRTN